MTNRDYDQATARAIFQLTSWAEAYAEDAGEDAQCNAPCIIKSEGVFINERFRIHSPRCAVLAWTPAYEMDWPESPNPSNAPLLPIPFTANELAACLLDGPGREIQDRLNARIGFPLGEGVLDGYFDLSGRWPRDALRDAYAIAANAQLQVGAFDHNEELAAHALMVEAGDANCRVPDDS